jgi:hypothetical protein
VSSRLASRLRAAAVSRIAWFIIGERDEKFTSGQNEVMRRLHCVSGQSVDGAIDTDKISSIYTILYLRIAPSRWRETLNVKVPDKHVTY